MKKDDKKSPEKSRPESDQAKNPDIKQDHNAGDPVPVSGPVLTELESNVYCLIDDYISTLPDPEMLKDHDGVFVGLLKYIYKHYIQYVLKNNSDDFYKCGARYDYKLLNELFNIYSQLVYQYKKNKQCYINEFCLFINMDKETIYNIKNNITVKATPADVANVKRWYAECEQSLLNGSGVADIFKLKSIYRYNDNLAPLPVEYQAAGLSVADLPKLGQKDSQKLLSDHHKDPKKDT